MEHPKRNYGIDLLRLVSMFMVVVLHVLGQGGVLSNSRGGGDRMAWLLEIAAYCAVDCYALISGYVGYREQEKHYRYSRYLSVWIPAFVYSFGIAAAAWLLGANSVTWKELLYSAMLVTTGKYWYVSAYTGLFFLVPFLNKAVRSASEKELNQMVLILFVVFSAYANFGNKWNDVFRLGGGYSFVWLTLLYLMGAWMKKNRIAEKGNLRFWGLLLVCGILIPWGYKIVRGGHFVSYVSLPILLVAVSLVAIFSELKIPSESAQRAIEFFAPAAFGVYLIHCQWLVWSHWMAGAFAWIAEEAVWKIPFEVLGCAFAIFAVCLLIERARLSLFRVLKLDDAIAFVQKKLDSWIDRYTLRS